VDEKLQVSDINAKACVIFGADRVAFLGKHFLEAVNDERLFHLLRQSLEAGESSKIPEGEDILAIMKDGENRYYQFSIVPLLLPSAPVQGAVLLLRDVTRLHELDRLKNEFVMTASHELRTPLTSIGMSVEMLLETAGPKLTEKESGLLKTCHEDVQRLRALINDLLELSKIEAGKLEFAMEPVDPTFLCHQALSVIKNQAESKQIEVSLDLPGELPEVMADPNKIAWVLVNLLANAVRYTPESGNIRLKGEQMGNWVQLSVSDNGEGVPYELQSRIFDKFVQVKGASGPGGSGLGLAICKEVVRAHRGTIWLESTPGLGSTFTFALPVAEG
jgi:NtrC-family two-component system sensor histidine kinase KinB